MDSMSIMEHLRKKLSFVPGLILDEETGLISGTPTTSGQYIVTIQASNARGVTTQQYTVNISEQPLDILTHEMPPAVNGAPYYLEMEAIGGVLPYTWDIRGLEAVSLGFDPATGIISGITNLIDPEVHPEIVARVRDAVGAESWIVYILEVW